MKSFVSLPFKIDWRDIANKIEPNDLTIYLRDDNNFTIGWDFEDIFTLNNELSLQGIDRYVKKHNGDFIFFNLGYNLKNLLEPKLRSKNPVFINFPDAELKCPSNLIQSINGSLYYFGNLSVKNITRFLKKKYNRCKSVSASVHLEQIESKEEYISKIEKIKSQIQRGDIYETNYCTAFRANFKSIDTLTCFQDLYDKTESPFAVYSRISSQVIINSSPERFLHKSKQKITSQPIKGTAKKGSNPIDNDAIINTLKRDIKELTENVMIVDLVRNDLSKLASKNSVQVDDLFRVKSFKNINQLVSTVSCHLKTDSSFTDILYATFPMGSMTGAPKVSAMRISEETESFNRNLYSGSQGYITPNGNFDSNVIIRTIFVDEKNKNLFIAVGGAITINSIPEKEYEECFEKIKSISSVIC